jgi:60 kDa SS-A/Ro ribonucleoprotein
MVPNSAGGYTFALDKWGRLSRWLTLGADKGSYYASEKTLTIENAKCVLECLADDAKRTVDTIVAISDSGRAPKNDPAIFALALASAKHIGLVKDALPRVCRIGTHVLSFVDTARKMRGWGAGLKKAVAGWYDGKDTDALAYQAVKYQQRDGVSHRDVLRLSHPSAPANQALYRWIVGASAEPRVVDRKKEGVKEYGPAGGLPQIVMAFEEAKTADRPRLIRLIREHNLPRECVPTTHLNDPEVWEALLERMPLNALVRNLGKMTEVGLLKPLSAGAKTVSGKLGDAEYIRKSRLHPIAILTALKVYGQGKGIKGSLSWTPVATVNDALDSSFYLAFKNVEPANKATLIALDVSGSMGWGNIAGSPLTPREASAAMAMVTARTEPQYAILGFSNTLVPIDIAQCSRLADVIKKIEAIPMGGTDCALPMLWAEANKINVETFLTFTDNETWFGSIHPFQALQKYRKGSGIAARSVVVGMQATNFTLADPADPLSLDVCGFDSSAPSVIADFSAGRF